MSELFYVCGLNEGWEIRRGPIQDDGTVGYYFRDKSEAEGWCIALNSAWRRGQEKASAAIAAKDAVIKSLDGHLVTDHGFCRICGKRVWGIGNNHADECPVPGVVACMVAANCEALAAARKETT